jgi:hypothetical protein
MRVRYESALLLLLLLFFHCASASANLQSSADRLEDSTSHNHAVGSRPRDVRRRTRSAQVSDPLSIDIHEQQSPIRLLQGGDDDATAGAGGGIDKDESCKGRKFQIIIHFDAYPEDFAMRLRNDVTNKTIWAFDDPDHKYSASQYQHKTVAAGVCLPRDWCWVLTVSDKYGDGYVRDAIKRLLISYGS